MPVCPPFAVTILIAIYLTIVTVAISNYNPKVQTEVNSRKTERNDLKKILEELEDSDYGSYGSWGNFRQPNPRRLVDDHSDSDSDYQIVNVESSRNLPLNGLTLTDYYYRNDAPLRRQFSDKIRKLDPNNVINFTSATLFMGIVSFTSFLAYFSVVPRNAPIIDYNRSFKEIFVRLGMSLVGPLLYIAIVYKNQDANINRVIRGFSFSFLVGYPFITVVELIVSTIVRILIFK